jgi:hypothetical protein
MHHSRNAVVGVIRIAAIETMSKAGVKYARIDKFDLDEDFVLHHTQIDNSA